MKLSNLVAALKPYNAVLVTGPQRSGTTIAGRILASELGYRYADEDEVRIHDHNKAYEVLKAGNVVLQAPGLCHHADLFTVKLNLAVVMMRRPVDDIYKSEARIHWRDLYGGANLKAEQDKYAARFGIYGDNIAAIKYFCWQEFQKPVLGERAFELEYDELRAHPYWTDKRETFDARQWQ